MGKPTASMWIVSRDILICIFDITGDWIYFWFLSFWYNNGGFRHRAQYHVLIYFLFTTCVMGTILSTWAIITSIGRAYRYKSLCCKCTVPRLAMSLILLHHVPQFIFTSWIDLTFSGRVTWAGWVNIASSMVALINTLSITKCGEGYCGAHSEGNRKEDGEMEIGTLGESNGGDYKQMSDDVV